MNDCKPDSKCFGDRARLVYKCSELKAAAKQCGNDVDSVLSIFQAKLRVDLFKTIRDLRNDVGDLWSAVSPHANLIANLNSISASLLPPSPSIFYGCSVEVDHVVNLVLNHAPARLAIHQDDFSLLLINAVDCIPLAVTLLSQLAESDSAEVLWTSWETESTKLVKSDGSAHRLNNLELSIELSLQGPRLRAGPGALDFFMMLCMLPQGLPELRIPEFEASFRNHFGGTRSAIRVLKQCSLAYTLDGYLRVLSPTLVKDSFRCTLPRLEEPGSRLLLQKGPDYVYIDDLPNAEKMLKAALKLHTESTDKLGQANSPQGLGELYTRLDRLEEAERALKFALDLHTEVNDKLSQANDLQNLGEVYTRLDLLEEAEQALHLGELYTRLDQLEEAERALKSALNVYSEVGSSQGQGHALVELGNLCITQCRFTEAQDFLTRAVDKYGHADYSDGQQEVEELVKFLREKQYQIIPEPHEPAIPINDTL
ncbi:hypothetical protein DFH09DRAFT_1088642 [Mycena vulgaris]|nr:hypothetical protein DFH09DRAFT_1088642 [Mycena vulgaris]